MNVALRQPVMTRDGFFLWAEAREERYEFDGFAPVAMTGGYDRAQRHFWQHAHCAGHPLEGQGLQTARTGFRHRDGR
jgi:hypothetical protein